MSAAVLVVDDSLTVRMDLAEAFDSAGLHAVACATAGEARQALSRESIALVVLDVLLPDADGIEFLKELRASPAISATPILLLSTEAEVRDRIRGLTTGADEYVGKPYDRSYVVARARELLRARVEAEAPAGLTVLLIDDSPTFREELGQSLSAEGYQVLTAASGEEGLRLAADTRPQAIIVDGILPGIDGATVIRHIRLDAALRRTPCLLLTAAEDRGAELSALDAGADGFVRKEEDIGLMLARLRASLRNRAVAVAEPETASLLGPKKILAVDDSLTYLQELSAALQGEGYDVVLARSGEEALELLAVQPVDCILLDLLMPGLSGQETCRRIKSAPVLREIPLIMLTALEEREAMIEGLGAGADDYIAKSSDLEVLKARVRAQIRRRQFEDENRKFRERLLHMELEASEARAARELAEARAALVEELERKNQELEAFSYSVSHDLRAPLRTIDGFSQALLEDCADGLGPTAGDYLQRLRSAAQRMSELIDDLLELSRVGRAELRREPVDLTALARAVAAELEHADSDRRVQMFIQDGLRAEADPHLLRIILENLLGNAWKFSAKRPDPVIQLGEDLREGQPAYFVRDNGVGFDMAYADKLFAPFQRLHAEAEFPGTGIGLATVYRVVDRHGGRVWAEGKVGEGTTVWWTLSPGPSGARDTR
jgi:two-component system NtrC family sensor kinase